MRIMASNLITSWQINGETMEGNCSWKMIAPWKKSMTNLYEGEIKSFSDKQKLREFCTTKPALQQILKDIL